MFLGNGLPKHENGKKKHYGCQDLLFKKQKGELPQTQEE